MFFATSVSLHNRELGTSSPWAVFWQLFATMGGQTAEGWEWYTWLGVWLLDAMATVSVWVYSIFFLLGHEKLGPLVIMLWTMLNQDVMLFLWIYGILLLGFVHAIKVLLPHEHWPELGFKLTKVMIDGLDQIQNISQRAEVSSENDQFTLRFPPIEQGFLHVLLLRVLLVSFFVIANLVLFNTLVAMMNNTYDKIEKEARLRWRLERVRIVCSLESEFDPKDHGQYWVQATQPDPLTGHKRYLLRRRLMPQSVSTARETQTGGGVIN